MILCLFSYLFNSGEQRPANAICGNAEQSPRSWLRRRNGLRQLRQTVAVLGSLLALQMTSIALAQTEIALPAAQKATVLKAKEAELHVRLERNAYGRPLWLQSSETANLVSGHAYAVLDAPFDTVDAAFKQPGRWCDVLMLHLNTKYCRASSNASPALLKVNVGKKTAQDLADTFPLEFTLTQAAATPDYLAVQLNAEKGPVGTTNYRIELEAVPLATGKTFMHLRYAYGYGMAGKLAMQAYLSTLGSGKIGFTPNETGKGGAMVGGLRGAIERNTMRYYLAIEAYLAALDKPAAEQAAARLNYWFDATEQFAPQLHEVDKTAYMAMKKAEYRRQAAAP